MRKKTKDALSVLHRVIEEKKARTLNEFRQGGKDVLFELVQHLGSEETEIAKGVFARITEQVNDNHFIVHCRMNDKAELALHCHSDYIESFKMIKGALFDKYTNRYIDNEITFKPSEWHHLAAIGYSEMIINCNKV